MAEAAEQKKRVTGAEAKRLKREVLGIPDQRKHHQRAAKPLTARAKEPGTQQRVYRYRFYPTEPQAEQLLQTFGACRWVHNEGLALRVKAWEEHRVSLGFAETSRALTGWRHAPETSWLQEISSTVLQQSLRHLDSAFTRFFKGAAKYPKPKRKHRSRDSATYVRTGFRWHENPERPGTGLVALAKQTEPLDIHWSRPLPAGVTPVKLTVTRDRAGRFFVHCLVEERIAQLPTACVAGSDAPKAIGIDLGLISLVTFDDGGTVDHPRLLKKYEKKLARLQKELHRGQRGSSNREKTRAKIAKLYALISDVRKDGLDQLTTRLVRENQVLVVEDLGVANLMRSVKLRNAIIDASWGTLLDMLQYKAAWYGRTLVVVDRFFPSTRLCSACQTMGVRLDLSVRSWTCAACGAVHDRDGNAALNLRDEGLRLYRLVATALPPDRTPPPVIRASELPECVTAA
ncbi:RNA-guided endonuclease InsQ/TnpB family protein [Streptomyces sp. NPDC058623]|uniref:RNA-guided endonuclease InsQ/TnpB family protein n=1 Tax=Streptomyces sp. NPDC058623 TaxID=3346563 RepID=UPI003669942A